MSGWGSKPRRTSWCCEESWSGANGRALLRCVRPPERASADRAAGRLSPQRTRPFDGEMPRNRRFLAKKASLGTGRAEGSWHFRRSASPSLRLADGSPRSSRCNPSDLSGATRAAPAGPARPARRSSHANRPEHRSRRILPFLRAEKSSSCPLSKIASNTFLITNNSLVEQNLFSHFLQDLAAPQAGARNVNRQKPSSRRHGGQSWRETANLTRQVGAAKPKHSIIPELGR